MPRRRDCSSTQTGTRVRTMHGSPPQTPGVESTPGDASSRSCATRRSSCAFSARLRAGSSSSTWRRALIPVPTLRDSTVGPRKAPEACIITAVDSILSFARAHEAEMAATIRRSVECESPSDDAAAVSRFVELVADTAAPFAKVKTYPGGKFGRLLVAEMQLPGRRKSGQVLALGHSDTVWPIGTLRSMPFRQVDGRLWGPGVLDMKAGIVFFLFAVRALRELDIAAGSKVLLQLNPDEEVGSEVSRPLTEKNAARSKAVLVLEPGTGLTGKLKTARKGVGDFRVVVKGRASHAGVEFEAGASAVLELARQIDHIASFTQLQRGVTVNPGVISGGTRSNVVAAEARVEVDIRVLRLRDAPALEKKFRALKPFDRRCSIEVTGLSLIH